ncbi:unnamed protein product [Trichobilharzia szidati]|nr:unnamed protein product [Trichobilharzia szidati]
MKWPGRRIESRLRASFRRLFGIRENSHISNLICHEPRHAESLPTQDLEHFHKTFHSTPHSLPNIDAVDNFNGSGEHIHHRNVDDDETYINDGIISPDIDINKMSKLCNSRFSDKSLIQCGKSCGEHCLSIVLNKDDTECMKNGQGEEIEEEYSSCTHKSDDGDDDDAADKSIQYFNDGKKVTVESNKNSPVKQIRSNYHLEHTYSEYALSKQQQGEYGNEYIRKSTSFSSNLTITPIKELNKLKQFRLPQEDYAKQWNPSINFCEVDNDYVDDDGTDEERRCSNGNLTSADDEHYFWMKSSSLSLNHIGIYDNDAGDDLDGSCEGVEESLPRKRKWCKNNVKSTPPTNSDKCDHTDEYNKVRDIYSPSYESFQRVNQECRDNSETHQLSLPSQYLLPHLQSGKSIIQSTTAKCENYGENSDKQHFNRSKTGSLRTNNKLEYDCSCETNTKRLYHNHHHHHHYHSHPHHQQQHRKHHRRIQQENQHDSNCTATGVRNTKNLKKYSTKFDNISLGNSTDSRECVSLAESTRKPYSFRIQRGDLKWFHQCGTRKVDRNTAKSCRKAMNTKTSTMAVTPGEIKTGTSHSRLFVGGAGERRKSIVKTTNTVTPITTTALEAHYGHTNQMNKELSKSAGSIVKEKRLHNHECSANKNSFVPLDLASVPKKHGLTGKHVVGRSQNSKSCASDDGDQGTSNEKPTLNNLVSSSTNSTRQNDQASELHSTKSPAYRKKYQRHFHHHDHQEQQQQQYQHHDKQHGALPPSKDLDKCPTGRHPDVNPEKPCICIMVKRMVIEQSKPIIHEWHSTPKRIHSVSSKTSKLFKHTHASDLDSNSTIAPNLPDFQLIRPTRMVRGGQGTVARVTNPTTGLNYALKFKTRDQRSDSTWVIEKREAHLLRYTNHEFIVKLYHVYETEDALFMALEWLDGGCLWNHIAKYGTMPECYALYYASCVLSALQYLHSKQIVYRDMKAENIVLDNRGRPKLVDFGMAKRFHFKRKSIEHIANSPSIEVSTNDSENFTDQPPTRYYFAAYLAPEIYDHTECNNQLIDSWGLGYIIIEMILGYGIFDPMPWEKDSKNHLSHQWKLVLPAKSSAYLSNYCEDLIYKMLVRNPEERLTLDEAMRHAFFSRVPWLHLTTFRGPDLSKCRPKDSVQMNTSTSSRSDQHRLLTMYDSQGQIPDMNFVKEFGVFYTSTKRSSFLSKHPKTQRLQVSRPLSNNKDVPSNDRVRMTDVRGPSEVKSSSHGSRNDCRKEVRKSGKSSGHSGVQAV